MTARWADLRDYQRDALEAVAATRESAPRAIVAIATGGGKGHIAGHLIEALGTDRVLFIVHRDTLVDQLERHVRRVVGGMVGVEQADRRAPPMARTVIASVQTLGARGGRRLAALLGRGFEALVTDEAHHSTAESYCEIQRALGLLVADHAKAERAAARKVYRLAQAGAAVWAGEIDAARKVLTAPPYRKTERPAVRHIGLTATPSRGDGIGLHQVFDEIVYRRELRQLVADGWLVPPVGYEIKTSIDLTGVATVGGDYSASGLEDACNQADHRQAIFDGWKEKAAGTRTLGFCATIKHAEDLAAHFAARGVPAWSIDGTMPRDEQRRIRERFAATPGSVLMSCQLIGEGVDIPAIETVLMARPTRSTTVYAQAIGRGTRLAAGARNLEESVKLGKAHCLVLDVTASSSRIGKRALRIADLVGAPWPDQIPDGVPVFEAVAQQEEAVKAKSRMVAVERISLMDSSGLPAHFRLAWLQAGDGYMLPAPDGMIRIRTDTLDRWVAERQAGDQWVALALKADPSQAAVVKAVEAWYQAAVGSTVLLDRSARWRNDEPTPGQLAKARRLRVPVDEADTKGSLADKITAALAASGAPVARLRQGPSGPGPCPVCEAETRLKRGSYGEFYSCARYPQCRGTRQAAPALTQ